MAMNYTPIPNDFLEEMSELTDAEYGRLIRWCQTYITTGEQIELRGNEKYHLVRCRMQMDRYTSHYAEVSRKRSAAGKKGGEANASKCKQTEASGGKRKETKTKTKTKTEYVVSDETTIAPSPTAPSLSEIEKFCLDQGSTSVAAAEFYSQYSRTGWKANGKPIENWRGLLTNYLRSGGGQRGQGVASTSPNGMTEARKNFARLQRILGQNGVTPTVPPNAKKNAEWMRRTLEAEE